MEPRNHFFDQLEPTFHANFYAYNGKPLETSFFHLSMHLWQEICCVKSVHIPNYSRPHFHAFEMNTER